MQLHPDALDTAEPFPPQLELSNNLAENSMRPVALGRRNWIHVGSEQAGPASLQSSRWSKLADGLKFRSASMSAPSCQAWQTFPLVGSQMLTPDCWLARA
jgi:hypothetical protein